MPNKLTGMGALSNREFESMRSALSAPQVNTAAKADKTIIGAQTVIPKDPQHEAGAATFSRAKGLLSK